MTNDFDPGRLAARIYRAEVARRLFGEPVTAVALARFELRRELGRGGMGRVYAAFDPARGHEVALKTLLEISPGGIYRLKSEFRSLAELSHRNLIRLFELFNDADAWFFTMELVDGVSFLEHVQPAAEGARTLDVRRLRAAFAQLVDGVRAIHAAGKLHCDLKPSNVRVTADGRVVIMDFGLVSEQAAGGRGRTLDACVAGTPPYMAPELFEGAAPSPAADWYALGVMLYQALTGELPFEQLPALAQMARKASESAPAPAERNPSIPAELNDLCCRLLASAPEQRPSGEELAAFFAMPRVEAARAEPPFVGRSAELAQLAAALRETRHGKPQTAFVSGVSGIGKTALLQRFVARLDDATIVLSGRCYARESLPYKVLDEVVDALCRHLRRLAPAALHALLPPHTAALARVFPVLRRVQAIAALAPDAELANQVELRRRAVAALKELLRRIARNAPLVIVIDDLQWGDRDSARMLDELLAQPDAPAALFLLGYRRDELGTSDCLRHFGALGNGSPLGLSLELQPLDAASSLTLAGSLIGRADALAAAVASEAEGHPMFLTWLAGYHRERRSAGDAARVTPTLEAVVLDQLGRSSGDAAALLGVLVVAREPLERSVAEQAAALDGGAADAIDALCAARLARAHGSERFDRLEVYHDRIRELLWARMSEADRHQRHDAIASALARCEVADPERLAEHLYAAGRFGAAFTQTCLAAENAERKLAFNRAAQLYRHAIACCERAGTRPAPELLRQLGDALVNAGRGAEAATAYLDASRLVSAAQGRQLRRDATLQLLFSGRADEALVVISELFRELQLKLPGPASGALWIANGVARQVLPERGPLARLLGGPALSREQANIASSIAIGMIAADMFWGVAHAARVLSAPTGSYDAETELMATGMMVYGLTLGNRMQALTDRLVLRAHRLAEDAATPWAHGVALLFESATHHFRGHYQLAADRALRSMTLFRDECVGASFYLSAAAAIRYAALEQHGAVAEIARDAPQLLRDARERGDLYAGMTLAIVAAYGHLLEDDPETALATLQSALSSDRRYGEMQRLLGFRLTEARAYAGHCRHAFEESDRALCEFRKSREYHLPYFRLAGHFIHGNAALAAYEQTGASRLLEIALADARTLARSPLPLGSAASQQVLAAVAHQRGDDERARALLRRAEQLYAANDCGMYALYARRARGLISDGPLGERLRAEADAALRAEGIADLARWTRMKLPGFAAAGGRAYAPPARNRAGIWS